LVEHTGWEGGRGRGQTSHHGAEQKEKKIKKKNKKRKLK